MCCRSTIWTALGITSVVGEGEEPDMEALVELFEAFVGCGVDPEMMG